MSDIESLGALVRGIVEDLPVPDTRLAALRLAEACARLNSALTSSVEPAGAAKLARAREHADKALARLNTASDNLDTYLASIGLDAADTGAGSVTAADSRGLATAPGSRDWWRQRVNMISDGDAKTEPVDVTVTKLFSELVERARNGDRDGYRRQLLRAGAAIGSKLPGLSWPMIRTLAGDVLGRAPTPKDDDRLRRLVDQPLRQLLPKLPEDTALSQLRGSCSLPHTNKDTESRAAPHPVDVAAAGPAMVAALAREREHVKGAN